ncbi:hypothetical protein BT69DRAFT_1350266 [Atractiella rhizophila]|nr:hypothetical protein BT69DRAFT_1350266 [Atractiella rhizophila]
MVKTSPKQTGTNYHWKDQYESSQRKTRSSLMSHKEESEAERYLKFPKAESTKCAIWERRDGVPILGSRRVRRVLLAAAFPEFYTKQEVDALHGLLDEEWTVKCHFFGEANDIPDQNRLEWRFRAGHFESIRWVGSRSVDRFGLSPWWAGTVISGLLNETPREYKKHASAFEEINWVVKLNTGGEKSPTFVRK